MESILEKIFVETYKLDSNIIDMRQIELDLATIYKIRFARDKFKHIMVECEFVRDHYFTLFTKKMVKTVDKNDVTKCINIFLSNLVRSCVEINESYDLQVIKHYIYINNGLIIDEQYLRFYAQMVYSDVELVKLMINKWEDIVTHEIIKKVRFSLNLNEDKVVPFLTENGYKFKISESDLEGISLNKDDVVEMLDKEIRSLTYDVGIEYDKVIELCNDTKESRASDWYRKEELREIINKHSLKEKEIVRKLGGKFVGFYNSETLKKFCSDNKIDLIPLMMIIGNMKNKKSY